MPVLGCIADDITGATDLASALVERGVPTALMFGVPQRTADIPQTAALVVALKIRSAPADDARRLATTSARWLQESGVSRLYVKYCSTFDSTPAGNIGPITDAVLGLTGTSTVLHSPSYPANGRTVYRGRLFVDDDLLSESGMRNHPLTPMTDANLVHVLGPQTPFGIGSIPLSAVRAGAAAVHDRIVALRSDGVTHMIADATEDSDLEVLAGAGHDLQVTAGGAPFGAAIGALHYRDRDLAVHTAVPAGPGVALCGSASTTTRAQIAAFEVRHPVLRLAPLEVAADPQPALNAARWALDRLDRDPDCPVMIATDTAAGAVRAAHRVLGRGEAAALMEQTLGEVARRLVAGGVGRLVVAGGETSGAVAGALAIRSVNIGPAIAPGVPWTVCADPQLAVAFKSGNFGGEDFFERAFDHQSAHGIRP